VSGAVGLTKRGDFTKFVKEHKNQTLALCVRSKLVGRRMYTIGCRGGQKGVISTNEKNSGTHIGQNEPISWEQKIPEGIVEKK